MDLKHKNGASTSKNPNPSPSFKHLVRPGRAERQSFPLPLPEPRTPRTNRTTERKRQQKIKKLNQQAAGLEEEIRIAKGAPSVSHACQELVNFMQRTEDPFIEANNAPSEPSWNRWFSTPRRRGWNCCYPF